MSYLNRRKFLLYSLASGVTALAVSCNQNNNPENSGSTVAAESCPRPPEMDARFCDRDGDLVADPPEYPADFVDPDPLIFAYTPVEDPAVYREVWSEFIEHLENVTGKKVEFFAVDSNAAQLEAMGAGRLHVAGFNTGSNPFAVNFAGFVPFAMMAAADGSYGYEMEIIVHKDSDIQKVEDLKGRELAFLRESAIVGVVGAGGIALSASVNALQWSQVSVIFLAIFVMVFISESVSATVRKRII
jgi:phosphonate transport system substrate-binding protein